MESTDTKSTHIAFVPTDEHNTWMGKLFVEGKTIVDPDYNNTGLYTLKTEAAKRAELVSHINYNYCLALKKGDFYFG